VSGTNRARLVAPVAAAALCLIAAACSSSSGSGSSSASASDVGKKTYTISYIQPPASFTTLQIVIADQLGYFTDAGITIKSEPDISNAVQIAQQVASGTADIGADGPSGSYAAIGQGLGLKDVGVLVPGTMFDLTLNNKTIQKLAAKGVTPSSPIAQRVQALKGLTLGVSAPGSSINVHMDELLKMFGVNPDKDVTLTPFSQGADALATAAAAGHIDGYGYSLPQGLAPVASGQGQVWVNLVQDVPTIGSDYQADLVANSSFLKNNPDAVAAYLGVIWKVDSLLKTDPDKAKAAARQAAAFKNLPQTVFDQCWNQAVKIMSAGLIPTQSGFDGTLKLVNGGLKNPVNLTQDQIYDLTAAQKSKPSDY
jgi:NitT/TauT family transport system substrate-binding protein